MQNRVNGSVMRLAILLTSNDRSEFALRFEDDGQKFATLLRPIRPDWHYQVYPVIDDIFPSSAHDHDAYIITGSPASVHDGDDWIDKLLVLIGEIEASRIPMIGACFGHQAIALALGGTVSKNPQGWVVGTAKTHFTRCNWMRPAHDALTLFAAHKEQVDRLPSCARSIGRTPGCEIAAFAIGDHVITTEYHPEMPDRFMRELVDEMNDELTSEQADTARKQIAAGAQGEIYAQWMANFLEMKRN